MSSRSTTPRSDCSTAPSPSATGSKTAPSSGRCSSARSEIGVDVFITVYGEDLAKVRQTTAAALAIRGEHTTWILDDGRSDAVRDLAAEFGANYVRRLSGNGAKAGNINHALTLAKGQYFAIFDADFVPKPDFLYETLPFFIDDHVAFVQTPQAYGNMNNLVSRGAGFMQSVFYRFIQPGRNRFNAAFCVGTNVVFRRAAIDDIGGMNTDSKSEDVWTSLELHERGWRSIYIPVTLADRRRSRDRRGLHEAADAMGLRRLRDPDAAQSPEPAHPADAGSASAVHRDRHALLRRHHPLPAAHGSAAGDLLRSATGGPDGDPAHLVPVLRRLLRTADAAGVPHDGVFPHRDSGAGDRLVPDLHRGAR